MPEALVFPILGRSFRAQAADGPLMDWLLEHWCFEEHDAAAHPFRIVLERIPPPGKLEGEPVSARLPDVTLPALRVGSASWVLGDRRAGVRLVLEACSAGIELWQDPPDRLPHAALFLALSESLRWSGLLPLHASIASSRSNVTAFLGARGAGKSTTLLQAVRVGCRPIAEDFAWLDPETLSVYGWDRGVHLHPESLDGPAREFASLGWGPAVDGKLFLPFDRLGTTVRQGTLTRLVALEPAYDAASRWEPLPPREAVRALWESLGVPLSDLSRDAAAARIPEILTRLATARLLLGRNPLPL